MAKILIVEDDQYIREMYALILRKESYTVVEAPDGSAGLTEAKQGGFDLVLLDLMMPQMDGLTFLKELKRQAPDAKNGSIIIMSNLAYNEAKDEAMKLGAKDFFVKADLEPKEIVNLVKKNLGK
jgi:DNA-binding response OmpR family regulator